MYLPHTLTLLPLYTSIPNCQAIFWGSTSLIYPSPFSCLIQTRIKDIQCLLTSYALNYLAIVLDEPLQQDFFFEKPDLVASLEVFHCYDKHYFFFFPASGGTNPFFSSWFLSFKRDNAYKKCPASPMAGRGYRMRREVLLGKQFPEHSFKPWVKV